MGKSLLGTLQAGLPGGPDDDKGNDGNGRPQLCGDIDIRIARDGTWFYHGSPIGRKPLVKLFASVLRRDADGTYWLITPAEQCRIRVDDAPFTAVEMSVEGEGRNRLLTFRTNVDENVNAGPDHPIRVVIDPETGEPSPYIYVRDGLEALIVRSVFYDLVELGVEALQDDGSRILGVWSGGMIFALGRIDGEFDGGGDDRGEG
jgi:hypothetical protein